MGTIRASEATVSDTDKPVRTNGPDPIVTNPADAPHGMPAAEGVVEAVTDAASDAANDTAGEVAGQIVAEAVSAAGKANPRDPEDAQRALVEVLDLLERLRSAGDEAGSDAAAVDGGIDGSVGSGVSDGSGDGAEGERVGPRSEAGYLAQLRTRLESLHPADVAYVLEALPPEERQIVWDSVKAEADGAILLEVSEPVRDSLIESMTGPELVAAARTLDADDLADIAADLPLEVVEEVRRQLTPAEREQLRAAMSYPEDTVGARMDFDLVTVREDVTLEVVLRYLRRFEALPSHTDQVFIVDRNDVLKGSLSIGRLLVSEPDALVADVMDKDVLALHGLDEAGEAAQAFERYDLVSAPVVDPHGHLIGRLTIEEVVDVIREESEAEIFSAAGLREDEDLFAPVWRSARNRGLWLALNLATAFTASRVIGVFEDTIERVVALAALMPIVAGIAGNSGNQTMALVIRALALGRVTPGNFRRLIRKELVVALLNGLVWGGIAGALTFLLYQGTPIAGKLALTMMLAMLLNLLIGALIGVAVPLLLDRFGRDPAIGSSVLLTFSTDSLGFMLFLGLATVLFRG